MKTIKNIFIVLVIIAIAGTIAVYFLPTEYTVTNSIVINRPANVVYAQVYNFNKWSAWSPWLEMDPATKVTIQGTPGVPGHKMSWDGKKVGAGSITIEASGADKFVRSNLEFIKPFKASAKDLMRLEPEGGKTKITWSTTGGLPFPFGRIFGLFANKMLSKDQVKGLDNLKNYTESLPATATVVADSTAKAM